MRVVKWFKSPWGISIGTAIFSFLLSVGYDVIKDIPILTTVGKGIEWLWNLVLSLLNFNIRLWWLLVAIALILLLRKVVKKADVVEAIKPELLNYREDNFPKWKWSWGWEYNKHKEAWVVKELRAHCPVCDTPMVDQSSSYVPYFDCPRCEYNSSDADCDMPHKIERVIIDNVERKMKAAQQ